MTATKSKVVITLVFALFLTACNTKDWSPIKIDPEYLKRADGTKVRQCDGSGVPLRNGGPEWFWEENNLPKGTTEFVCVDGKAYLPDQLPKD